MSQPAARHTRPPTSSARPQGFTLLELIVTILVLGVLAAIAVVAYGQYTERAQGAAADTELHQYATALMAQATARGDTQLTRAALLAGLEQADLTVTDSVTAAGTLTLIPATTAPTGRDQLSTAFDNGEGTPAGNTGGTRATLVTATPSGREHHIVVSLAGVQCAGDIPAGTPAADARTCGSTPTPTPSTDPLPTGGAVNDIATTLSGWPVDVDVTANDQAGVGAVASLTSPGHGTATLDGTSVRYVSTDGFIGSDTFTYTTANGARGRVDVTVKPLTECDTTFPAGYTIPTRPGSSAACPVQSVSEPATNPGAAADTEASGQVRSITSYPHSSLVYPHYLYLTTADGGVRWVKDAGATSAVSASGWLYGPGTFNGPSAAMTGEGPHHGTLPAVFTVDSMFVADSDGIWVSKVTAFVSSNAPTKLADTSQLGGHVTAMTGYQCYSGLTPVAGDCVWFGTDSGTMGQLNVNSGHVDLFDLQAVTNPVWGNDMTSEVAQAMQMTTEGGVPTVLETTDWGDIVHLRVDGVVSTMSWNTASSGDAPWASAFVDGKLAMADQSTVWVTNTPAGDYDFTDVPGTTTGTTQAGGIDSVRAMHSHGVPGVFYLTDGPCLYRTSVAGAATPIWCATSVSDGGLSAGAVRGLEAAGEALSVDGTTVAVGGPQDASNTGVVQMWTRGLNGGFAPQATLRLPDGAAGDEFGKAVAVHGDTLVVGAPGHNGGDGAVYLYTRDAAGDWAGPQTLDVGSPAGWGSRMGSTVATNGQQILVGVPLDDSRAPSGHVNVYSRTAAGWSLSSALVPPADVCHTTWHTLSWFGLGMVLDGNQLAVGSKYSCPWTSTQYTRIDTYQAQPDGTWVAQSPIQAGNTVMDSGHSVLALHGDTLAVGTTEAAARKGAVQVYTRTGSSWALQATIPAPDADSYQFGKTVALSDTTLVVGDYGADGQVIPGYGSLTKAGAVYTYTRSGTTWSGPVKWSSPLAWPNWTLYYQGGGLVADPQYSGQFGTAVALSDGELLVTEPFAGTTSTYSRLWGHLQ